MDTSEYARFRRPGHRVTGDRSLRPPAPRFIDVVHAIIDDHSRPAYAEIHPDAKAATVVGFLSAPPLLRARIAAAADDG
jgi:hypothetical protein